jgi:hypothetical protein
MSFGLEPSEYLEFLSESYEEYCRDPLSVRKAVVCCIFANHLPDYLVAKYFASDRDKLRRATTREDYRSSLETAEPALAVIRDLCDYAKHGPTLSRRNVTVTKTERATTMEMDWGFYYWSGFPNHRHVEKLVVAHKDGSEGWMESYLLKAIEFWQAEFIAYAL